MVTWVAVKYPAPCWGEWGRRAPSSCRGHLLLPLASCPNTLAERQPWSPSWAPWEPRAGFPGQTVSGSTACRAACLPSRRGRVSATDGETTSSAEAAGLNSDLRLAFCVWTRQVSQTGRKTEQTQIYYSKTRTALLTLALPSEFPSTTKPRL